MSEHDEKIERLKKSWEDLQKRTAPIPPPGQVDYGSSHEPPKHEEKKGSAFLRNVLELGELLKAAAGVPPPLPAAARAVSALKKPNPMADALFSGMQHAAKPGLGSVLSAPSAGKNMLLSKLTKSAGEKTALGKMLGELVKKQTDPTRLANISRLATSRGAQLAAQSAPTAKKYLAVGTAAAQRMAKAAHELTSEDRKDLPKKDFAVPASKSNTGDKAYPIPDKQHARSALGFAKMQGDSADYARVRAKVEQKYPELLKKKAMVTAATQVFSSKEASGMLRRILADPGHHKQELLGLGTLMAAPLDQLQAHGRAAVSGNYNKEEVKKREFLPHWAHPALEVGGLGVLMGPSIQGLRH